MTTPNIAATHSPDQAQETATFLTLLPALETHARIVFRDVACPNTRADKIAEMVALAWGWYIGLRQRGKDVRAFRMVFVFLVASTVRSGRRVCGQLNGKDVLSE